MLMISTYVSHSPIQGFGVFAAEPVPRGHMMWLLDPRFDIFVAESEIAMLPPHMREFLERYSYPHLERPGVVVLDSDNGKYMNHSEMPNTDFRIFDRGFAVVDIAAGDELTCNYAEFDPHFKGIFPDARIASAALAADAVSLVR